MANVLDSGARRRPTTPRATTYRRPANATRPTPGGYDPTKPNGGFQSQPSQISFNENYLQAKRDYRSQADLLNMLNQPAPAAPSGGGGGRSYGGGGGGGGDAEAKAQAAMQATALQQLLGSNQFKAKSIDEDLGRVGAAVSADQGAARGAYDQLAASMGGMGNPYQGMQVARTPQVAPELLALLGANGGDGRAYEAQVGLANTLGAQSDSAADRLTQRMAGMVNQSRDSRVAEAGQASQFAQSELGAQRMGMEEALRARQRTEQQGLDQQKLQVIMQLIQAMSEGGTPVDVGQFFQ